MESCLKHTSPNGDTNGKSENKNRGNTFCGKFVQCIKEAKTEAPKGLRERNMSLYKVRNYLSGFRRVSQVNLFQKRREGISTVPRKMSISVQRYLWQYGTATPTKLEEPVGNS